MKETASRPPWWKGARGEWWVAGQGVLLAAIALAPAAWRWSWPAPAAWRIVGAACGLTGAALAWRAIRELGPSLSPFPVPRQQAILVRSSIYARARHPIYGGLIMAAAGWALWRTSGLHLALAAVFAAYMAAKASREERFLLERFPDYAEYRSKTARFIPGLY
ncbi:MAG: isoprenylcysteine carboxylmethyltransferase family protein [Armatimonadota bacterium]|nr:isoprenylcysteine carboxylmethyltransferase family protein [Armatimonadota bacterium]